jgi:ATP-dependent Clp protease ATP-binding subunit ClpA
MPPAPERGRVRKIGPTKATRVNVRVQRVLSSELESCLNQAFHQARSAHHEFLTVEHLLLAILGTPTGREVLTGCGADLDQLGAALQQHVAADNLLRVPVPGEEQTVQPQLSFQRVLQRAAFHVKSNGKSEIGVDNVLVAIFSEKHSRATLLLAGARVTRPDVVNYLQS